MKQLQAEVFFSEHHEAIYRALFRSETRGQEPGKHFAGSYCQNFYSRAEAQKSRSFGPLRRRLCFSCCQRNRLDKNRYGD
jgi:hypothetical protein